MTRLCGVLGQVLDNNVKIEAFNEDEGVCTLARPVRWLFLYEEQSEGKDAVEEGSRYFDPELLLGPDSEPSLLPRKTLVGFDDSGLQLSTKCRTRTSRRGRVL